MFEGIVEQDRVKSHLAAAIENHTVSHAYLFLGEQGIGKLTMALAFAQALLCPKAVGACGHCISCEKVSHGNHPDLLVISAEKNETAIKISQIRRLISQLAVKPYEAERRVIVIRGGDAMTTEAQNALLKSLEEPEHFNTFIITAKDGEAILQTIRSRCQVLSFEPVSRAGIQQVLRERGIADEGLLEAAVYDSEGSVGKALGFFENQALESLKVEALEVFYAILKGDVFRLFAFAEKMGKSKQDSLEVLNFLILWFHDTALVLAGAPAAASPYREKQRRFVDILTPERNEAVLGALFELMDHLVYNVNLRLQWESTMLKI